MFFWYFVKSDGLAYSDSRNFLLENGMAGPTPLVKGLVLDLTRTSRVKSCFNPGVLWVRGRYPGPSDIDPKQFQFFHTAILHGFFSIAMRFRFPIS